MVVLDHDVHRVSRHEPIEQIADSVTRERVPYFRMHLSSTSAAPFYNVDRMLARDEIRYGIGTRTRL